MKKRQHGAWEEGGPISDIRVWQSWLVLTCLYYSSLAFLVPPPSFLPCCTSYNRFLWVIECGEFLQHVTIRETHALNCAVLRDCENAHCSTAIIIIHFVSLAVLLSTMGLNIQARLVNDLLNGQILADLSLCFRAGCAVL